MLGEYAALIAPLAAGPAFVTHDALGLMPVFTLAKDDALHVSTRLAELVPHTDATLDDRYLAEWIATGSYRDSRTPYPAIRRLLPGESAEWDAGRLCVATTWKPRRRPPPPAVDDPERVRELIDVAVRGAVAPDGPTWAEASGGLDSSTVLATAADAGVAVEALSHTFPGWRDADERPWMETITTSRGVPWHEIDGRELAPFQAWPVPFLGEPYAAMIDSASIEATDRLLAAHGVRALLSGHGGDELFATDVGLPHFLADPFFEGRPVTAVRELRAWRRERWSSRSWGFMLAHGVLRPAIRHLRGQTAITHASKLPSWLTPDLVLAHRLERRAPRTRGHRARAPGRQVTWDSLWLIALTGAAMRQRDVGYEYRNPLCDLRLVEWMTSLPWERITRPGTDRWLLRTAMSDRLPERILKRRSKGVPSNPIVEGLARSTTWTELLTDDPLIAERGLVDRDRWRLAVRRARVGHLEADRFFIAAATLEAWLRQLEERRVVAPPHALV